MTDEDQLAAVFVHQVERFAKQSAYEAEPAAWRAPALREPSPDVRPIASPSLWETVAPPAVRARQALTPVNAVTGEALALAPRQSWACRCTRCRVAKLRITPGSRRQRRKRRRNPVRRAFLHGIAILLCIYAAVGIITALLYFSQH